MPPACSSAYVLLTQKAVYRDLVARSGRLSYLQGNIVVFGNFSMKSSGLLLGLLLSLFCCPMFGARVSASGSDEALPAESADSRSPPEADLFPGPSPTEQAIEKALKNCQMAKEVYQALLS